MSYIEKREMAITLRKKEMSYSQIKKKVNVSKSTLSLWLRSYPLSPKRIKELRDCNEKRIERFRSTMRQKREEREKITYIQQSKRLSSFSTKELFLAGLMLYWGEGTKTQKDALIMTNSNPSIINFFILWTTKILHVPSKKIRVCLHLYSDMDPKKEIDWWSHTISIPISQFNQPYIKKSLKKRINYKGSFGHGTCQAKICDVKTAEKILMSIKYINEKYKGI